MTCEILHAGAKKVCTKLTLQAVGLIFITLIIGIYIRTQFSPPEAITDSVAFEVTQGMSVRDIADKAQILGLVRSSAILYVILTYSHDPTNIYAGTFTFNEAMSVFKVAEKLASNEIEKNLVRLTIPEGMRLTEIAQIAKKVLPDFDVDEYLVATENREGYLFPETYFVPKTFTAKDLIALQEKSYEENIQPIRSDIELSNLTEYEVLILASIVEREANDSESMKIVAGILQNRLAINMALQADASIEYILDKPLSKLTAEDLKIDSPYNTYLNTGLVPTPIGNPGNMAIEAVVHPTSTKYFYYITDEDGIFHYAETFSEHNRNIDKYLR